MMSRKKRVPGAVVTLVMALTAIGPQAMAAPDPSGEATNQPLSLQRADPVDKPDPGRDKGTATSGRRTPEYTGRVVVKFRSGISATRPDKRKDAAVANAARASGAVLRLERASAVGAVVVRGAAPRKAASVARAFASQHDVEYAVPDEVVRPNAQPNDPHYAQQWDLADTYPGIGAERAWSLSSGAGAVIAVVDTGLTNHPEFSGRVLPGYDMISDAAAARDGNGRDTDPTDAGDWEEVGQCGADEFSPSSWHGTHVAGTALAATNNGVGIAGVAGSAKLLPVRVLGACGGSSIDVADGIAWAAGLDVPGEPRNTNPADVINLSLGGAGSCRPYTQQVITAARARGVVVVTAAGNEADAAQDYQPGNCNGVIDVAASEDDGSDAWFSNFGSPIAIAAPGASILSAWNTGPRQGASPTYGFMSGTSMAAPHVSGVAALIKSANPTATPDQVRAALISSAKRAADCFGCGAGLLDAPGALAAAGVKANQPRVTSVSPLTGGTSGGDTVTLTGSDLASPTSVTFGGTAATIVSASATRVTVATPARRTPGTVPVVLTTASGRSGGSFTYVAAPVVRSLAPRTGSPAGSTQVTITGSGLADATKVSFGQGQAQIVSRSDTALVVTTPRKLADDPATVPITVHTPRGVNAVSSGARFAYVVPTPQVQRLSERQGSPAGGNTITVTGRGLVDIDHVTFNGQTVDFTRVDDTSFTLTVPALAQVEPGVKQLAAPIVVHNLWGAESRPYSYRYVVPVPTLQRASVRQGNPDGGYPVTLSGRQLEDVHALTVDGAPVEFTRDNDGLTIMSMPPMTQGKDRVSIVAANPWTQSREFAFRYVVPVPRVTALSQRDALPTGGEIVTITGTGLDEIVTLTVGDHSLSRGDVAGQSTFTLDNAQGTISFVTSRYEGPVMRSVDLPITLTNKWGASSRPYRFRYVLPKPVVERLTGSAGYGLVTGGSTAGGQLVRIQGVGTGAATQVLFGRASAQIIEVGDDFVEVVAPASSAGTVTIQVTTPAGRSAATEAAQYVYADATS